MIKYRILFKNIYLFYFTAFAVMVWAFYTNLFGILNPSFKDFQKDDEGLVIGRIILSKNYGIFENSGLDGTIGSWGDPKYDQHKIYLNNTPINKNEFHAYQSQIGGQGFFFSILDSILPFDNQTKLDFFHLLTSIFTAITFLLFLVWVKKQFGFTTALITLILILLSFWIIIFSDKLWWSLWNFYLPFVFMLFYLNKQKPEDLKPTKLFFYSFLLLFIKSFFTGYEYITTTLIMLAIPLLYYSILYQWQFKITIHLLLKISIGAILGLLSTISILIFQISNLKHKEMNMNGFEYLYDTLLRRTYDDPNKREGVLYYKSMQSSTWEVLQIYLNGPAYKLKTHHFQYEVSFGILIVFFFCITLFYFAFKNKTSFFIANKNKYKALIIAFWVSISAPISWFIIFKSHSYIHTHMNFIIWYLPFALLGYVLIGCICSDIIKKLKPHNRKNP
jgi:hypothetical protein